MLGADSNFYGVFTSVKKKLLVKYSFDRWSFCTWQIQTFFINEKNKSLKTTLCFQKSRPIKWKIENSVRFDLNESFNEQHCQQKMKECS